MEIERCDPRGSDFATALHRHRRQSRVTWAMMVFQYCPTENVRRFSMQTASNAHFLLFLPFSPSLPEAADLFVKDNIYDG